MMMTDWSGTFITYLTWKWESSTRLFWNNDGKSRKTQIEKTELADSSNISLCPFPLGPAGTGPVNPEMEMKLKIEMKTKI